MKKATSLFCIALTSSALLGDLNVFADTKPPKATEEYTVPVIKDNLAQLKIAPKGKLYKAVKVEGFNEHLYYHKNRPFELIGSGGVNSRVIDKNGKIVFSPDARSKSIQAISSSPDEKRVIIRLAEGAGAFVLYPDGVGFKLPTSPPEGDRFVFDQWNWIDNDTLIAMSGDMKLDKNGKPVNSDDNIAKTRIYIYKISQNELTELELPGYMKDIKLVQFVGVSNGCVHLMHDDVNTTFPNDLGWFEIKDQRR